MGGGNNMTYRQRLSFLIFIDSIIVFTTIFFSRFLLSIDLNIITTPLVVSSITLLVSHHIFSSYFKLYKKAWEYASVGELISIFKSVTLSIITTAIVQQIIVDNILIRVLLVTWMLHLLLIGGSRFSWRIFRDAYLKGVENKKRTLVIGAGSAGIMVTRQLLKNHDAELLPVAFIDDDVKKKGLYVMDIPVVGGIAEIESAVNDMNIDNIVIAIPSLSKKELNIIFQECAKTKAKTQILPMLEDLMTGKVSVNEFRDVKVEDLLGREPVKLDNDNIAESVTGKTIMITGAGGSIGSEICRQISKFNPARVILLGHGENSIYTIELELKGTYGDSIEFITEIADVQDRNKMFAIMDKYKPNKVYHAAAHKHVPLMERNPEEAVKNNVIGTKNVSEAASAANVETFVMVSTDKAVNPTNVMGSTKRMAEMIVQHMDTISETKFVAVRFGNVLGSRGSVIPLFKKQIQAGGPVTVTHPDMVRYFMTIPEASRLVIQAGALARGGEIFVLDMGDPVKIVDLAKNLIKLSGYTIDEIGIEFSGVRPGEKLYEELLNEDEIHNKQVFPMIYIGKTATIYIEEIQEILANFESMEKNKLAELVKDLANNRLEKKEQQVVTNV
jgi:FlaA1/EpsC-like NDP-sugar epimerase